MVKKTKKTKAGREEVAFVGAQSIPWRIPEDEYWRIALRQRKLIRDIADKLEDGEPLTEWERTRAAERLRLAADAINTKRPNQRGSNKLDAFSVVAEFQILVIDNNLSKNAAYAQLAQQFNCSDQAIKDIVRKYGDAGFMAVTGRKG